jgi:hypothetical protein
VTVLGLHIGVPGVYFDTRARPAPLRTERLDITGFAGIAPRGPVDDPVPVNSWSEFRHIFGGVEGPGLLGYAVHAFFAQGGARAHVLRVSPLPRAPDPVARDARARHVVEVGAEPSGTTRIQLYARNEGVWGDHLAIRWTFSADQRFSARLRTGVLDLPDGVDVPAFSLLRLRAPELPAAGVFGWSGEVFRRDVSLGLRVPATPVAAVRAAMADAVDVDVAVVTLGVVIADDDPQLRRQETFAGLGLRPGHRRYVLDVLRTDSQLVTPDDAADAMLPADPFLGTVFSTLDRGGTDRTAAISERSFVEDDLDVSRLPVAGVDGLPEGLTVNGVERLSLVPEIGLLVVPDLLWDGVDVQVPPPEAPGPRGTPGFAPCAPAPPPVTYAARAGGRLLDGAYEAPLVLRRQRRVAELAARQQRFVALLDVPPHLTVRAIARWRAQLEGSYVAAYHPWLRVVVPEDPSRRTVAIPPSAVAAGIIAEREIRLGLSWGPSAELAVDPVLGADPVSDADHETLFGLGVNVFRAERDGLRLSSARTLSADASYRQLSVRRLMTMLRLAIERQLQWLVFEPHTSRLRLVLTTTLVRLLRELYRAGAFAGDSEQQAFFVRCDESLNPRWSSDLGRLVAEVGVAPAEPLEFLVVRVTQDADGTLGVEGEP